MYSTLVNINNIQWC